MTLKTDLDKAIQAVAALPNFDVKLPQGAAPMAGVFVELHDFIRDHGPALQAALDNAERWQAFCDLADAGDVALPHLLVDAHHMGAGVIERHVDEWLAIAGAVPDAAIAEGDSREA